MNSGVTADRVYDALKRRILALEFRPGVRLDPALLSETLSSSVTPVRESLNRLRGEGLIETRTGEGFFLPQVDAPGLQDLYDWNLDVLLVALRRGQWPIPGGDGIARPGDRDDDIVEQTADLFALLAHGSTNPEHRQALGSLNDRLRMARIAETDLFDDGRAELANIRRAFGAGSAAEIRKTLTVYHRRRRHHAAKIVRSLYRHDAIGLGDAVLDNRRIKKG